MEEYKTKNESIMKKSLNYCENSNDVNTMEEDIKEIPEDFIQIKDALLNIIDLSQQKDTDEKLASSINFFLQILQNFKEYINQIIQLFYHIDHTIYLESEEKIFDFLSYIYLWKRDDPNIVKNILCLFLYITIEFPFKFWEPLFSSDIVGDLTESIPHPSTSLHNKMINGNLVFMDFGEDTFKVREIIICILRHYFYHIYQHYKIEEENDELFNRYADKYFECLIQCADAVSNANNLIQFPFLIDFLNFLLEIICENFNVQNIEEPQLISLTSVVHALQNYVLNTSYPSLNIAFYNLSKLVNITKYLSFYKPDYFLLIFGNFMNDEQFRIEHQKSFVLFISSVVFTHNYDYIKSMMSVIFEIPGFMMTLATHPDVNERVKFSILCGELVQNCFIGIDLLPDENSAKIKYKLNSMGNEIINFLYNNNIIFYLADLALNDDFFNLKVYSARSLADISIFLPYKMLVELIMRYQFISIFCQFVDSEDYVFKMVLTALRSILFMIGEMPVNKESAALYMKLVESGLLDQIAQCDMIYEDQTILDNAGLVLNKANDQRNRFSAFLEKKKK